MRGPGFDFHRLTSLPKVALWGLPVALILIVGVGIALATGSGGSKPQASAVVLSSGVGPDVAPTQTPVRAAAPASTAVPTPTAAANRANCAQIQGTAYQSDTERTWYLANCGSGALTAASASSGSTGSSQSSTSSAPPAPAPAPAPVAAANGSFVSGQAPGPVADELVLSRLGVDGPVHTSVVGADGQMGTPDGKDDIVWYDFSGFQGLGGYPGMGGNAVFAGHVDYHPHYLAVFWYLRDAVPGDIIDYYTASGQHLQYTVDWNIDAAPDADFTQYVEQTGQDIMTIITCDGVFDPNTGHYDHRTVVRAHRTG